MGEVSKPTESQGGPMKLSNLLLPGHPVRRYDWAHYDHVSCLDIESVTLDGEPLKDALVADERYGFVVRISSRGELSLCTGTVSVNRRSRPKKASQ